MNRMIENDILNDIHILLYDEQTQASSFYKTELELIKENFCGNVFHIDAFDISKCESQTIIYLCGNIKKIIERFGFKNLEVIRIVKQFSNNLEVNNLQVIDVGEIPINVHNVGIYFRKLFSSDKDYYSAITNEHRFQNLGMSDKPGRAYRKGIYLTKVREFEDEIKFKLLRCSTNLSGSTDNFRQTDNEIIDKVNKSCQHFFSEKVELNHVLAQTYHNAIINNSEKTKERKAKIAEHSDKTKDMPKNAVITFCSFYEGYSDNGFNDSELACVKKSIENPYDYFYKNTSVLTKLRFRLKKSVTCDKMKQQFDITLYPNSVFIMPLSTNRLYTHEIIPSSLPINKIPTRMGYIIRCSNTDATFKDEQTYILKHGKYIKLEEPNKEGLQELRELYYKENTSTEIVDYDDKFYFSMNRGDYQKPML